MIFLKREDIFKLCLGVAFVILLGSLVSVCRFEERSVVVSGFYSGRTVIVDAGHGGEDGGAVSKDGVVEKIINLQISRKLELILNFSGVDTEMTRREDLSLCNDGSVSLRERKNKDLKLRLKKVEDIPDAVLISIHQNSFPEDLSCHGAQTFFSDNNTESKKLAGEIQTVLAEKVDSSNKRIEKAAPDTVFLMKKAKCPAVLVECGFLTNEKELGLLVDRPYQMKLAAGICSGYLNYKK